MKNNTFKRVKIEGWRQFQEIDLELHPKLTIITGANGAGKSTILSFINRHFGYSRPYLATPHTKGGIISLTFGLFSALKRGFGFYKSPNQGAQIGEIEYTNGSSALLRLPLGQSLHYQVQIEGQQSIPGIHIDSHRPPNIYRHVAQFSATPPSLLGLGNSLNNEYINYFQSGNSGQGSLHHIKMNLIQMSIFGHGNPSMEPVPGLLELFAGFEEKLRSILPKSLGFQSLIIRSPEVLISTKTGDFLIDAASGGVIKLIEIAWQIYFFSQEYKDFVVTFDEPENHLHPSMQKTFLPSIIEAFPEIQIIVVTHSPFIISAMQDSIVYVLRYAETEVSSLEFGDDESIRGLMGSRVSAQRLDTINKAGTASEILREVLGISSTIPDWAENRVAQIIQEHASEDLSDALLKELFKKLEAEGLASSYPAAVSAIARAK
jgi:ABC-type cobalamin/Fe3+-siderophores transport system ATPase subunit